MVPTKATRRAVSRLARWITIKTGYTEDQLRGGLQVTVGLFILMAAVSTPRAWNALSLADSALTPTYAIVTFAVVLQPNLGTAFQFVVMRILGAMVGGLLGLLAMYITYGANGSSYAGSTTKGAVMVTLLSVFAFGLGLFRFRFSRHWFAFVVATFSMPMVALNSYWLGYVQYKALFYWWLQMALGVGVAVLVSMTVTPITAGRKVRSKTQECLKGLGQLTETVLSEMLLPRLRPDGLLPGVKGRLEVAMPGAVDEGLKDAVAPMYDTANSIAASVEVIRALLKAVPTEFDIYSPAHLFPTQAYDLLKLNLRAYLSSLMMLVYPLQSGKLSLRAVQAFEPQLQEAGCLLARAMAQLAGCIDNTVSYKAALHSLRALEHHWHVLGALCPTPEAGWSENDVLTVDMVLASLFSLGTRVRRMFLAMPDAIHTEQPNCRAYAARHFKASAVWDMLPPTTGLRRRALRRTETAMSGRLEGSLPSPREVLSPKAQQVLSAARQSQFLRHQSQARLGSAVKAGHLEGAAPQPNGGDLAGTGTHAKGMVSAAGLSIGNGARLKDFLAGGDVADSFPPLALVPPIRYSLAERALRWVHAVTGFNDLHLSLALQLALSLAAASLLHVADRSYNALQQRTIWVAVTVAVVFESSLGGIILKSSMRIIGTVLAGVLGVGLLYLTVLINGGNYENHPAKFISMSVFLPLAGGLVMVNHMRIPHQYAYALSVAKFTTPIVALSGYVGTKVAWQTALWRLCNIVIGIGIDLAATTLIFPVTGRRAARSKIQEILHELAGLSEAVLTQFVSGPGLQPASPLGTPARGGTPRAGSGSATPRSSVTPLRTLSSGFGTTSPRQLAGDVEMGMAPPQAQHGAQQAAQQAERQAQLAGGLPSALDLVQLQSPVPSSGQGAQHAQRAGQQGQPDQQPALAGGLPSVRDLPGLQGLYYPTAGSGGIDGEQQRGTEQSGDVGVPRLAGPGGEHEDKGEATTGSPAAAAAAATAAPGEAPDICSLGEELLRAAQQQQQGLGGQRPRGASGAGPGAHQGAYGGGSVDGWWGQGRAAATTTSTTAGTARSQDALLRPGSEEQLRGLAGPGWSSEEGQPWPPSHADDGSQPAGQGQQHHVDQQQQQQQQREWHVEGGGDPAERPAVPPGASPQAMPSARVTPMLGALSPSEPSVGSVPPSPERRPMQLRPLHIPAHHSSEEPSNRSPAEGSASPLTATPRGGSAGGMAFLSTTPRDRRVRAKRSQWLTRHALGRVFVTIHDQSVGLAGLLNQLGELALFSKYEWDPFSQPRRLPYEDIRFAQRACRKMLNVLLSFTYVLDAPDIPHLHLLEPFAKEVKTVAAQMRACLEALSHVVSRHISIDSALGMVATLNLQVQLLLLEVEQGGMPAGATEADVVLGYASLGVMFSATQTVQLLWLQQSLGSPLSDFVDCVCPRLPSLQVQLLYQAVIKLLGSPEEVAAVQRSLDQTAAWGASVEALLVAQGVVLSHLASSVDEEPAVADLPLRMGD
ncbi:hypothetical protein N2152v2_003582 [Parachlorella kessleri]